MSRVFKPLLGLEIADNRFQGKYIHLLCSLDAMTLTRCSCFNHAELCNPSTYICGCICYC